MSRISDKRALEFLWKKRLRAAIIPLLLLVLTLVFVGIVRSCAKREPLSSKEILAKETWTEEELTKTLGRVFTPQSNRHNRAQVLQHLRKQLNHYSPEKQEEIRAKAMAAATSESLKQFRAMEENDRKAFIKSLKERAENNYAQVRKMPANDKAAIRKRLDSESGQQLTNEINRVLHKEFTAAERREFAPLTKIWIQTLKEIN